MKQHVCYEEVLQAVEEITILSFLKIESFYISAIYPTMRTFTMLKFFLTISINIVWIRRDIYCFNKRYGYNLVNILKAEALNKNL